MKVLLKQARIQSTASPYHGQVKDILVVDGIIETISDQVNVQADHTIQNANLHVSIGWMDLFAHFSDPGYEFRETLESGARAAAAGGFTDVLVVPNTNPVVASKTQIEYIIQKAAPLAVSIHPLGAVTKNAEGRELAEMYDMYASGAVAFSDGLQPVQQPGVMLKALQYVLARESTIIQLPDDRSIAAHGLMNEGIASTRLGLPGKPAIAEELMIARDIELLKYTGSRLHITGISTRRGLEMVAKAKTDGLNITCSVTPYHSYFCDEDLAGYDTNLKVNPPLRTADDRDAIREAMNNGTADCIASHHVPLHWDDKTCEFEYAKSGMTGLESLFGVVNQYVTSLDTLINMLTIHPRMIVNLPIPEIKEGSMACLSLFDPAIPYTFDATMIRSTAKNNAFTGKPLRGKVIGILNKNHLVINES